MLSQHNILPTLQWLYKPQRIQEKTTYICQLTEWRNADAAISGDFSM